MMKKFDEVKVYQACDIEGLALLFDIALFLQKSLIYIFLDKTTFSAILEKTVETKQKTYFSVKKPSPHKSMLFAKFQVFDNKTQPDSTLIQRGKEENLEFEKLSHFMNLLDFQLLSLQVLSRIVVIPFRLSSNSSGLY